MGSDSSEHEAYVGGQRVLWGTLHHVGGGVHALGVGVVQQVPAGVDVPEFTVRCIEADGVATDDFTTVEHERINGMAADWVKGHVRRVTTDVSRFKSGDLVIAEEPICGATMKVRWFRRPPFSFPVRIVGDPKQIDVDTTEPVDVTPARSPGASGDSADLAMFCGTIAATLDMNASLAATGDISPAGEVLKVGSMEEKMRAARVGDVRHLMVPGAYRYQPGNRDGYQLWVAWTPADAAFTLLDAAAREKTVRDYRRRVPPVAKAAAGVGWAGLVAGVSTMWLGAIAETAPVTIGGGVAAAGFGSILYSHRRRR